MAVVLVGPMAPFWALSSISLSIERAPPLRNSCMQISFVFVKSSIFFSCSLFLSLHVIYFAVAVF